MPPLLSTRYFSSNCQKIEDFGHRLPALYRAGRPIGPYDMMIAGQSLRADPGNQECQEIRTGTGTAA